MRNAQNDGGFARSAASVVNSTVYLREISCPRHVFLEIPLEIRYSGVKVVSGNFRGNKAFRPPRGTWKYPFRARPPSRPTTIHHARCAPTITQNKFSANQQTGAAPRDLWCALRSCGMSTPDETRAALSQARQDGLITVTEYLAELRKLPAQAGGWGVRRRRPVVPLRAGAYPLRRDP